MQQLRRFAFAAAFAAFGFPAAAADTAHRVCLNKEAQRTAISTGQAIPLAEAVKVSRSSHKGDLVRARLCRGTNGLVYVLTLLSRNGKVTRATIDAGNGSVIGGR